MRRTAALPCKQRGAALLLSMLLAIVGVGLFVVNAWQEPERLTLTERVVAQRLNEARDALISMAVAHPQRPGALPCPDTDGDGIANPDTPGACTRNIGRLPWRTLGLGDLRDASGETLWYALSPHFRNVAAINSDTKGTIVVRSSSASVTQTDQAVAVVFAPGGVLAGQDRGAGTASCSTTGTTIQRTQCPANYLETTAGTNNASTTGPYIMAEQTAVFNDRLIVLRTSDLMPLVERRVGTDLRRVLVEYHTAMKKAFTGTGCNCYPWPDGDNDGISNIGDNKGRIPVATAAPRNWGTNVQDAAGTVFTLPVLPAYFQPNNWHTVVFYAVGRNALENLGIACTTCTMDTLLPPPQPLQGTLEIDGKIGHAVILITPGSAGASRPSVTWGDYIDDAANRDGDDRFVNPTSASPDRDRLYTIAGDVYPSSCGTNGQMLVKESPCHTTGTSVKPVCQQAHDNLQICKQCSGDAYWILQPPCRNSLNPTQCQGYVSALQSCKL